MKASRGGAALGRALLRRSAAAASAAAASAVLSATLQGCDVPHVTGYVTADLRIETHALPDWRMAPDYWVTNSYVDPDTGEHAFNSCSSPDLSVGQVCSGHGSCVPFDPHAQDPVFFCQCQDEWAGVECRHLRLKQTTVWMLSLFFGPLGLDEIYMGQPQLALHKVLVVLLGLVVAIVAAEGIGTGIVIFVWMFDVVRIGTGPVHTDAHRVQPNLPRSVFAAITLFYFCFLGMAVAIRKTYRDVLAKRRRYDLLQTYGAIKSLA